MNLLNELYIWLNLILYTILQIYYNIKITTTDKHRRINKFNTHFKHLEITDLLKGLNNICQYCNIIKRSFLK